MEEEWLPWMRDVHVPDVMATGFFVGCEIRKLLDPINDPELVTYNFQYECRTMDHLKAYQEKDAARLQADHNERYKDRFVAFRTLLERI